MTLHIVLTAFNAIVWFIAGLTVGGSLALWYYRRMFNKALDAARYYDGLLPKGRRHRV